MRPNYAAPCWINPGSFHCSPEMYRIALATPDDLDGFRYAARGLIAAGTDPADVLWDCGPEAGLFAGQAPPASDTPLMLPARFAPLAKDVICHADPERFALLYECVWRIVHSGPGLLADASDPLMHRLMRMQKAVARDLHKMTAFVRFRQVVDDAGERYVAWFEPEHHILGRAGTFFCDRFASMRWTILTPQGALHWDGTALTHGPGVARRDAPSQDALEAWWLTYYRATFNPARANETAMRSEMPRKYWRNLPEAAVIPDLLAASAARTHGMVAAAPTMPRRTVAPAVPAVPTVSGLAACARAASACTRCALHQHATQTVFGEGPQDAAVVFVGEQPGDHEDLAGRPFVGPAGQVFDRALAQVGIDRARVYVTNAVKHFKFEPRGKRRIHARPNTGEIEHCRWWLDQELALIRPQLTVALGATAARALTGRTVTIARERGTPFSLPSGASALITVHPSFLLRLPDPEAQAREFARFAEDLAHVAARIPAIRNAA
jgi:probable DNA metabolism protein